MLQNYIYIFIFTFSEVIYVCDLHIFLSRIINIPFTSKFIFRKRNNSQCLISIQSDIHSVFYSILSLPGYHYFDILQQMIKKYNIQGNNSFLIPLSLIYFLLYEKNSNKNIFVYFLFDITPKNCVTMSIKTLRIYNKPICKDNNM